jgi:hypothetical protein
MFFMLSTRKKTFLSTSIRVVNFFETFCTCSPSSLEQDLIVESAHLFYFIFSFGPLELEVAVLGCFLR